MEFITDLDDKEDYYKLYDGNLNLMLVTPSKISLLEELQKLTFSYLDKAVLVMALNDYRFINGYKVERVKI